MNTTTDLTTLPVEPKRRGRKPRAVVTPPVPPAEPKKRGRKRRETPRDFTLLTITRPYYWLMKKYIINYTGEQQNELVARLFDAEFVRLHGRLPQPEDFVPPTPIIIPT